jgi:hypothetical protein
MLVKVIVTRDDDRAWKVLRRKTIVNVRRRRVVGGDLAGTTRHQFFSATARHRRRRVAFRKVKQKHQRPPPTAVEKSPTPSGKISDRNPHNQRVALQCSAASACSARPYHRLSHWYDPTMYGVCIYGYLDTGARFDEKGIRYQSVQFAWEDHSLPNLLAAIQKVFQLPAYTSSK